MSSSKKEEAGADAAERLKAAALSAAKGLSRAQAERAAAAAVRNVNAYGQKEEGPSRWQERKEAKRQMYLMSTEKQVRLGERKDLKTTVSTTIGNAASQCQKCFQAGHWTYECKNERVYISRPSRTQQLKNPKLRMKPATYDLDDADISNEVEDEKHLKKSKSKRKSKRKHRSDTESGTDSEASVFESGSSGTGSDRSSGESESSYSSSSDSEEERRRRRRKKQKQQKQRKRRHRKYSSTSESSDSVSESESESESDSEDRSTRKRSSRKR